MKRIFTAVKVDESENLRSMMNSFRSGLKEDLVKWTDPGNIHITLTFLGDTDDVTIKKLVNLLRRECSGFGDFEIELKGAGVFRNMHDPRIIWTGLENSEKLHHLYKIVAGCVKSAGKVLEERSFSPHLTLGRVKKINDPANLSRLLESHKDKRIQIVPVREVILFESLLKPTGPVYVPLDKFSL